MRISQQDHRRVQEAIGLAEAGTSADFVCVLLRRSARHEFYPLAWAALLALATPWLLVLATGWPVLDILLAQLLVFAAASTILSWPLLRRRLVPRGSQRAAAHRAATEQFFIRGLANTPDRRGILLFVSHDERYARILADEGAAHGIPPERWQEGIALLVGGARQGRHAEGFVAALEHCGRVMAERFPPDAARAGSLPDKFHVVD